MGNSPPTQGTLYTIAVSHYCEIARWALHAKGWDGQEVAYMPGLHLLSGLEKIRKKGGSSSEESTGTGHSMPLLLSRDGRILAGDSWQVLQEYGEVPDDIKKLLNEKVGPQTRAIAYSFYLSAEMAPTFQALASSMPVAMWQKFAWRFARGTISERMWAQMVKDEDHVKAKKDELDAALTELEKVLPGGPFAPRPDGMPSAAAIALSALLAPVLRPNRYGGGLFDNEAAFGPLSAAPQAFQDLAAAYRQRPAGQFAMQTYERRMERLSSAQQ